MSKTSSNISESSLEAETAHEIRKNEAETDHASAEGFGEEQQSEDKREKTLRAVKDPVNVGAWIKFCSRVLKLANRLQE